MATVRCQVKVGNFIEEYLSKCKKISLIVFLIDIRHSPTENDRLMYQYIINTNSPCLIIASKADKIAVTKVSGVLEDLQQELNPLKDLTFLPQKEKYTVKMCGIILKIIFRFFG